LKTKAANMARDQAYYEAQNKIEQARLFIFARDIIQQLRQRK